MGHKINLIGTIVGQLTVVSKASNSKDNRPMYNCVCICGADKIVSARNLQRFSTTHCGCIKRKSEIKNEDAALNALISVYKSNAKKKNLVCNLTKHEFIKLFDDRCYYCNKLPSRIFKKSQIKTQYVYNGIDRVNNQEGYTNINTVSCCTTCNYMKSNYTKEEFLNIIFSIANNFHKER